MKKAISVFTAFTTILWLSGLFMILPVNAVTFADGDLAREADEFDVYIVKLVGAKKFKRLILNPDVFNMYGHLKWGDIQVVADGTLAAYTTSELVRADGDEKVYKLYPDGDVGTKKWVESLDCFTSQGFDWDSVYVINTFDRDSYTTASASLCGGAVVEGDITLSLASDTPAADSIPYNAEGVPYLKFNVAGSGTITQLVLKRSGVGEAADFDNVYLYEGDTRLTSGRSVSSSTNKTTFISLSIVAPTAITLVADLAGNSTDDGHISAFSVESASDVTSGATVGGTFPIAGNLLAVTSIQGGTLTVQKNGSIGSPTVGQSQAQITQFKLTGAREAINISRITLYNGGNMNSPEITNVKLKDVSGTVVATAGAFGSDDLCAFVFDTPYELAKGDSKIFKVYADLAGDKDDTIKLYFEVSADIKGTGATYGHGSEVVITSFDGTDNTERHDLTLEGGELTIAFNGPTATDVADDTDDTSFLDLSFTAASNLEIRKMQVYVCYYEEGSADDADTTNQDEIEDIKLKDKDTGTILMGPTDGDNFTLEAAGSTTTICGSKVGLYKEWTDIWDLDAGDTKNLLITGDIAVPSSGAQTDELDGWKMVLRGYANLSSPVKYRGTNDYVANADIVPSTDITGNLMTIKQSSISVALASIPVGDVDKVRGQTGVTAMGIIFTAGDASDMEVTDLVLNAYVQDASGDSDYVIGKTADGLYAKNVVNNVALYESDGTTKLTNGGPKGLASGTSDSEATFDNLSWTVSAGETKKMLVVVDITTTATSGSTDYDYVYFDIDAVDDVTAIDDEGTSRNPSAVDLQATEDTPDVRILKSDGGTLTVAAAAAGIRREQTYVYQSQTDAEFSKFKFTTEREAFLIDKVRIETESADLKYIAKVELEYPINAAGTLVSPRPAGYFGSLASVTFDLTGKEMYVPKDDYAYLTVYADLTAYVDAGDTAAADWGLDFEGDDAADFHAVGVGSSRVIQGGESTNGTIATTASGVDMYVKRTFPSFTVDGPTGSTGATMPTTILEFTITNNGDYDLVFNSTTGELKFRVMGSGAQTGNADFTLYKSDGTSVNEITVTTPGAPGGNRASATFPFDDSYNVTIEAGQSQGFYIDITSGKSVWDENGDYLQLRLENTADMVKWLDGSDLTYSGYVVGSKYIGIPIVGPEFSISGL